MSWQWNCSVPFKWFLRYFIDKLESGKACISSVNCHIFSFLLFDLLKITFPLDRIRIGNGIKWRARLHASVSPPDINTLKCKGSNICVHSRISLKCSTKTFLFFILIFTIVNGTTPVKLLHAVFTGWDSAYVCSVRLLTLHFCKA